MISQFTFSTNTQKGMTMIEILIALAISAILLTGVIQIFVSNKQTAADRHEKRMTKNKMAGFTLIQLMIVVAIIALISECVANS